METARGRAPGSRQLTSAITTFSLSSGRASATVFQPGCCLRHQPHLAPSSTSPPSRLHISQGFGNNCKQVQQHETLLWWTNTPSGRSERTQSCRYRSHSAQSTEKMSENCWQNLAGALLRYLDERIELLLRCQLRDSTLVQPAALCCRVHKRSEEEHQRKRRDPSHSPHRFLFAANKQRIWGLHTNLAIVQLYPGTNWFRCVPRSMGNQYQYWEDSNRSIRVGW
eukprot:467464-Rhodomonas_salina.2